MQADAFTDERMKVLYALSFMCGGTAQVWAANKTMAVINGMSQMQTLDIFLENVEKTFGDPDRAHTARAQLHNLKMTPGTTAEDYTAQFEMLVAGPALMTKHSRTHTFEGSPTPFCTKFLHRSHSPKV